MLSLILTPKNHPKKGFTSHHQPVTINQITCTPKSGIFCGHINNDHTLENHQAQIEAILDDAGLVEADILSGLYDHAEVEIYYHNTKIRHTHIGKITLNNGKFTAELEGLEHKLERHIGEFYSPLCRAELGDSQCSLTITSVTGTVATTDGSRTLTDPKRTEAPGYFAYGILTFTSGENVHHQFEIKYYHPSTLELTLATPHPIKIGDTYTLTPGCDKRFETCTTRYNNAVNFRGEPHIPGLT